MLPTPGEHPKRGPGGPLFGRFKGKGVLGEGGNRNPPSPGRLFAFFLGEQKEGAGPGRVGLEPPLSENAPNLSVEFTKT